ncbi:TIGR01777 family protein [Virgibacillus sp. MSP4-1]|uniref:TIGR01777 family oxidoreductase n=1 Tax=Virgibacillus sp. MSP4-1 TaxID=2700081 RepID=UPI000399E18E|nr:TIGR01777 family oxidoreductase [Virgibacillus sp. MSP4-1]QHS22324.1 TIGR01777 family protein [Virgibacillus sp. MSP4-1]
MNVLIAGGTGFIGRHLVQSMVQKQNHVYVLTRSHQNPNHSPYLHYITWFTHDEQIFEALPPIDAVINLAGEPINKGRWTRKKKTKIRDSRKQSTQKLLQFMQSSAIKPKVFINASAIGIYGNSNDQEFTERSAPQKNSFPARVCTMWEQEAIQAEQIGIRTVMARIGIVLGKDGGALPRMIMPYKLFAGGRVASGKQWLSWIHIYDLTQLFDYIIHQEAIEGPINMTAPNPVQMDTMGKKIGENLRRPHWFPVPSWILKIIFGEMNEILTEGQKVIPDKALKHGFEFHYSECGQALRQIFREDTNKG